MELKDITKEAVTISENASFKDAIMSMVRDQTNSLLVTNDNGELVGEINMHHILDAIVPEYLDGDNIAAHFASSEMFEEAVRDASELKVSLFMSKDTTPIHEDDGLMLVATSAITNKRAHIPVVNSENKPVGMISRRGIKHIVANVLGIEDSN